MRKSLEKIIKKIKNTGRVAKTSALTALLAAFLSAKAENTEKNNTNFYKPPAPTNLWMRCYGNCRLDVDDEIIFYNARVPCGWTKITNPREYSCFIYGDDPYTKMEDGARQNDQLFAWIYDNSEGKEFFATLTGDEARFLVDEKKNFSIEKAKVSITKDERGNYALSWPQSGAREMTYEVYYTNNLGSDWTLAIDGLKENSWTDDGSTTSGLSKQRFYRVVAY